MKSLQSVRLATLLGIVFCGMSCWLFWQASEPSARTVLELPRSADLAEFHGSMLTKSLESKVLPEVSPSRVVGKNAESLPKATNSSNIAVGSLSPIESSANFSSWVSDRVSESKKTQEHGLVHFLDSFGLMPRVAGHFSAAPAAAQSPASGWVETSMNISIPAEAPVPAVVAASLEIAAGESTNAASSSSAIPGMNRILNEYLFKAERPAPEEEKLEQALEAADLADERFRMLYGHEAYLKYTIEAARLSLQEYR